MGEYAEMDIFARMRGKMSSDLSASEFRQFYSEYDLKPKGKPVKSKCENCGKVLRSVKGLRQHMIDKHKEEPSRFRADTDEKGQWL